MNLHLTTYFLKWLIDPKAQNGLGFIYSTMLVLIQFLTSLARNSFQFRAVELGITVRKGLSAVVFKKILRLNEASRHKVSSGKFVSLISGEIQAFER